MCRFNCEHVDDSTSVEWCQSVVAARVGAARRTRPAYKLETHAMIVWEKWRFSAQGPCMQGLQIWEKRRALGCAIWFMPYVRDAAVSVTCCVRWLANYEQFLFLQSHMSLYKSCEHAQPKSRIAIKENLVLASFSLVLEIFFLFQSRS